MASLKETFGSYDLRAKLGLGIGAAIILLAMAWALWWVMSPKQQLLFGNLRQTDAAEIAKALDEWKVPHGFTDDSTGILVDAKDVPAVRMRLVSAGVPRGGHVGFELFDNHDLGVTEFAQRINYQRALQGELERSIATLPGVSDVRVHLSIERAALFLGQKEESKASVVLGMAPGAELSSKEIGGIKGLVAAAVEDLSPDAVVVIGPGGALLSGGAAQGGTEMSGQHEQDGQLAGEIERRVRDLLGNALGNRDASVEVDVRLNFDKVSRTSERLLPLSGSNAGAVTHRESGGSHPGEGETTPTSSNERVDYAYGKEREEVTQAAGTIQRISIAVVLPRGLPADQIDRLRRLIAASAGLDPARGDLLEIGVAPISAHADANPSGKSGVALDVPPGPDESRGHGSSIEPWLIAAMLVLGMLAGLLLAALLRRPKKLSPQEAELTAEQIRAWLSKGESLP
ncbi:MAG TPA: flagellar basal-body MS-ring/collar protein FliF [Rhodanobacter sp.]